MRIEIFQVHAPVTSHIATAFGPDRLTPREVEMFNHAQDLGPVYVAQVDGNFVACWGIIPPSYMSQKAYLWFWGPPVRFPIAVLRHSRKVIKEALSHYECLYGQCAIGTASIRWMQWLGAEFGSPKDGLIPFEIWRPTNG